MIIAVQQIFAEEKVKRNGEYYYDQECDQRVFQIPHEFSLSDNHAGKKDNGGGNLVCRGLCFQHIFPISFVHKSTRHFSFVKESEKAEKQEEYKGKDLLIRAVGSESDKTEKAQKTEASQLGIQFSGDLGSALHTSVCNDFPNQYNKEI